MQPFFNPNIKINVMTQIFKSKTRKEIKDHKFPHKMTKLIQFNAYPPI